VSESEPVKTKSKKQLPLWLETTAWQEQV